MFIKARKFALTSALAALVLVVGSADADDTDVYTNAGNTVPLTGQPRVMFSIDYRPNLGSTACNGNECAKLIAEGYLPANGPYTFFDVLRGSLQKVFSKLSGVQVGLMVNHDSANCAGPGANKCSNGGYMAMGFQPFQADDGNGAKQRFNDILTAMPTPKGNVSHSYQGKELFFEFFRYLTGQVVYNGHNGWTDFGTSNQENLNEDNEKMSWDTTIENVAAAGAFPSYISPLATAEACAKIFTINLMFQVSQQEDNSDAAIQAPVAAGGFGSPQAGFPNAIRYLYDADLANGAYGTAPELDGKQNVISYFIVDPSKINETTRGYAKAGGSGEPLALSDDPDELVATLEEVFRQILSVSTTFVAASVPVNVFNRAQLTEDVYIALFQLDDENRPSWVGNVKKLKLAGANDAATAGTIIDANGNPAVAGDGRIRFDALTSWTDANTLPAPDADVGEVAGRDGRSVARGGAGQRIPGFLADGPRLRNGMGGRTIYYDKTSSSLAAFNVDAATAAELRPDFDAANDAEAARLIAFARGLDIDDLDGDLNVAEARDWVFGDALHSRPLPLNYGDIGSYSETNQAIFVAVASNDGMLRMIRNTTDGGNESGEEVWAFMPRAAMDAQKVLRANGAGSDHPYTIDGAPVAFVQDVNNDGKIVSGDGDSVYLYVGMRRGGKSYYALDVTNPTSPRLMWTLSKGADGSDFGELGYTFSTPRVGLVRPASDADPVPALMFGGGYDMNKDLRGDVGSNDSEGNAIYVVNAETGALIWKAVGDGSSSSTVFKHNKLDDSIPSPLTVADTDGDQLIDRIIVGDTGGNVWRADLFGEDTSDWNLTLLATVGRHYEKDIENDRRFFHRPDLVPSKDADGLFDAVVIGSGDRADPLDLGGAVDNFTYMIKDRQTAVGSNTDSDVEHADFGDVTSNCLQDGSCTVNLDDGWRLEMVQAGEKVLATPLTIASKVFFTSYLPNAGEGPTKCSPTEGMGRLYAVSLQDATAVINYDTSDDDAGSPGVPSTDADRSVDLRSMGIPAEVVSVPPNKILRPDLQIDTVDATTRWRTYWFLQEDSDL